MREFRGDGIRHRRAHRRQPARQRTHHAAANFQIARIPVRARAGVARDDRTIGQPRRQFRHHTLRIYLAARRRLRTLVEHALPALVRLHDAVAPALLALLFEQRQQRAQRGRAVTDEADFHRIAQAQHARVDVDLHGARIALLRQKFGVRKARSHHQQGIARRHHLVGRFRAEQSDRAGHPRQVVRHDGLAQQRLGYPRMQTFGHGDHFVSGLQRACAHQHRHAMPGVEHICRAL